MNDDDDTKKDASLSVSETNALRKRLGLAPLKEETLTTLTTTRREESDDDDEKEKRAAQKEEEEETLREKLKERKRRKMDRLNAKRLYEGEEGEEEDAKTWVQKSRRLNKKTTTTTRSSKGGRNSTRDMARRYEEEDEEHGVVEYTEKDLAGLKVDRAALEVVAKGEDGGDGDGVVLTLADKSVLDSDSEDELENVRVTERERNAKNKKLAGKGNKKDEIMREDEDELTGLKKKKILSKYDDEYGEEEKDEKFMTLDGTGGIQKDAEEIRKRNAKELKLRMAGLVKGELTSAEVSKTATQTDAYTKEEEELIKFNSSKKKKKKKAGKEDKSKKIRKKKKKKENDEDSDDEDGGFDVSKLEGDELAKEANAAATHRRSRKTTNGNAGEEQPSRDDEAWAKAMDKARDNVDEKILANLAGDTKKEGEPLDFATEEEEDELERALATARETKKKTKEKKIIPANGEQSLFERIAKLEREKPTDMNADNTRNTDENLALTDVAEFCRGVGLDTSGGDDESNAFVAKGRTSKNLKRKRANHIEEETNGEEIDWEKARADKLPDEEDEDAPQIVQTGDAVDVKMEDDGGVAEQQQQQHEEKSKTTNPIRRNIGLASVLQDMKASGQLEDKGPRWSGRANDLKDHHDRRRVLEASGVIQEGARSSETQKFNFKLDKYDEFGRTLTPKEAFRELCWKFHGKAPGAKAKEKRLRKYEEEQNALRDGDGNKGGNAIERMQAVQKTTGDSFVVLSGKISEGQRRNAK
jgi:U4/U6.U5 tri-snRNP-associated protein 1